MGLYELNDNEVGLQISQTYTTFYSNKKQGHTHKHYEIMNIEMPSGSVGRFHIKNEDYIFDTNSLILVPPGFEHLTTKKPNHTFRTIVSSTHDFIKPAASFVGVNLRSLFAHNILHYSPAKIAEIKNIFSMLNKEYKSVADPYKSPKLRALLALLISEISQYESVAKPTPKEKSKIDEVIKFIKTNYSRNISLELLAENFDMNKYAVCRQIKEKTHQNLTEILASLRVNKATDLLETTDMSIAQVADSVGMKSLAYFSKVFKEHTGTTPVEYRHANWKGSKEDLEKMESMEK